MRSYVTQEYDFFEAITKNLNLNSPMYKNFAINKVNHITNNSTIVKTSHGNFLCESFEDDEANIFMKVCPFI